MRRCVPLSLLLATAVACSFPDYRTAPELKTSCGNGVRDGEETGVDCGPGCEPCQPCNNGIQDSDETGVDCGGSCSECPSCDDGKRNGSESDVDCGGSCAKRCDTDQRCLEAGDCTSLVCASVCQPATCADATRNGAETSVDCGGGACPECKSGQHCGADTDCETSLCQQELCVSPDCSNQTRDNDETDVDCGGPECAPCPDQASCLLPRDCASSECDSSGACSPATCSDAKQNQAETAVDCGGPNCQPCADGSSCMQPSDCVSSLCQNGTCVSSCAGYALNFDGNALVKVDRLVQDDFTIEAWIKTTATASNGAHYWNGAGLFWADVIGGGDDFGASMLGSHIAFGTGKADGGEVNLVGASVNSGDWTHVAVARQKSAEQLQIFINGTLDRSVTDASQTAALKASTSLQIGGNSNDKRYYRGVIDEVRGNVVRTATELDANKNRRLAGNEAGLVAYWRFDDAAGLLASDSGPSQNHGILQGPPTWVLSDAPLCP